MRYIVLGKTELKKELFNKDLTNDGINKPVGGLWSSPYTPGKKYISDWDRFCKEENFDKEDWSKGIIFKLKDNARIYTIDSYEDLTVLVNKYPNEKSIIRTDALDFNKIAEDYDAIHLTEEGNLVNPTTGNTAYVHYYSCGQCDYCQAEEYNCGQCGYCYEEYIVEEEA